MARSAPPLAAGRLAAPLASSYQTLGAQESRIDRCPTADGDGSSSSSSVDSYDGHTLRLVTLLLRVEQDTQKC
jgi:hypothetical protein